MNILMFQKCAENLDPCFQINIFQLNKQKKYFL